MVSCGDQAAPSSTHLCHGFHTFTRIVCVTHRPHGSCVRICDKVLKRAAQPILPFSEKNPNIVHQRQQLFLVIFCIFCLDMCSGSGVHIQSPLSFFTTSDAQATRHSQAWQRRRTYAGHAPKMSVDKWLDLSILVLGNVVELPGKILALLLSHLHQCAHDTVVACGMDSH